MPLPQFIGIGAPRSGTRWLAQCLAEHPQVSLPPDEVYFFTTRRVVHSFWNRGIDWYDNLLAQGNKPGATTWGEITPVYLLDDETPGLIHQCVPNVKLLCLLRDQSERAYSWYRFFLNANPDLYHSNYTFRRFLTYHTEVFGREGFYLEHIDRYLKYFPRDSLLVLLYEDIVRNPLQLIRQVYEHLGVDSTFVPPSIRARVNDARLAAPRSRLVSQFAKALAPLPVLGRLSSRLEKLNTKKLRTDKTNPRHMLDPEMRSRMHDLYLDHNRRLGAFLGSDLSHWNRGAPRISQDI